MALTVDDIADLLRLLSDHPEWRAQLRPVVLGEEILELPSKVDRVEARLGSVEDQLKVINARMDALDKRMEAFEKRMDRMDGRLGNIEGQLLELRYERQLGSWFGKWLKAPQKVSTSELEVFEAAESGQITEDELAGVEHLDLIVSGVDRTADGEKLVLAVEVSYTINQEDVTWAFDRAGVLRKAGFRARAFTGGYRATEEAERLAEKLDVIIDLHAPAA